MTLLWPYTRCLPVSPVFSMDVIAEVLSYLKKVNSVSLSFGVADAETMLMGDCRLPLQYWGEILGQVVSSISRKGT